MFDNQKLAQENLSYIGSFPILTRLIALDNMLLLTPQSSVDNLQELDQILTPGAFHKAIKTAQELPYDEVPWFIIKRPKILAWVIAKYYDQFSHQIGQWLKADISELINEILVKAPGLHGVDSVSFDYLKENCKRIPEALARTIHPQLFIRLEEDNEK